ncbi:hypothetical protein Pcinc_006673 [Petrolisthes cinctipes]|uniref:Uncharacterized protein n=1 Tax=Petrolisthes cinctipes TaxID=88211 RepID=A0AAE1GGV8_PETCI|nr:hypothetical protein Pcinc_006673 [Petrolisthes cinctipes]
MEEAGVSPEYVLSEVSCQCDNYYPWNPADLETCHKFESGIQNGNAELQSESVLPSVPQSGSFMVVVEGEAAHIERTRKLDTKLLEKKIEAEEKRIEAEKRRIEAYIAQKKYYTQLLLIDSKKNNKV